MYSNCVEEGDSSLWVVGLPVPCSKLKKMGCLFAGSKSVPS